MLWGQNVMTTIAKTRSISHLLTRFEGVDKSSGARYGTMENGVLAHLFLRLRNEVGVQR